MGGTGVGAALGIGTGPTVLGAVGRTEVVGVGVGEGFATGVGFGVDAAGTMLMAVSVIVKITALEMR